jgi:4-hydroxybenzoate polyprenyltransferase
MEIAAGFFSRLETWGSLVRFSHSLFAMPFALAMLVVAATRSAVTPAKILYILIAIVAARTAAMAWNRLIDRQIDAANPRTVGRELPRGVVSTKSVWQLVAIASCIFLWASWMLGMHCFVLAPAVLLLLLGYSLTKRFTAFSHMVLGLSLAAAPGGVWYAIVGTIELTPIILMTSVLCWVAGFDVLYALQDEQFDRANGLYSIPSRFGRDSAYKISAVLHVACLFF